MQPKLHTAEGAGPGAEGILKVAQGGLLQALQADFEPQNSLQHVKATGASYLQSLRERQTASWLLRKSGKSRVKIAISESAFLIPHIKTRFFLFDTIACRFA